jgi:hypothetical protein
LLGHGENKSGEESKEDEDINGMKEADDVVVHALVGLIGRQSDMGARSTQFLEALYYKPDGRGFDSR